MEGRNVLMDKIGNPHIDPRVERNLKHMDSKWYSETHSKPFNQYIIPGPGMQPDRPEFNPFVVNDVEYVEPKVKPVYGSDRYNMKLLRDTSARITQITDALRMINNTSKPLNLVELINACPSYSRKFREILNNAYSEDLKAELELQKELYDYIYGEPPAEEQPSDNPGVVDVDIDNVSIESSDGNQTIDANDIYEVP